jgi:RecA-family ATPase
MLTLKQIAAALNGRISGDWVIAPALGHSRKDDSLHVQPNDTARYGFVIALHAAGATEADKIANREYVRDKLGVPNADHTNGATAPRSRSGDDIAAMLRSSVAAQKPKGKLIAVYPYTDAAGTLLYEKLRFEPKRFHYRLPDGSHKGPPEDRRVVYRWPDLVKFPSATVFITEGEKDADRIASLDLCATTAASGKWTEECLAALKDRDCWIIQDCDEPGKKKALELAELLLPLAASVKIVHLPGLTGEKDNKDVSDWLDQGHTKGELERACTDAPDWTYGNASAVAAAEIEPAEAINVPATLSIGAIETALLQSKPTAKLKAKEAAPPPLPFINIAAWDSEPVPDQAWSVFNRFPLRQAVLFSGEGAAGKSTIYLHLCGAHVLGKNWLGGLPEPGPALFIEAEDGPDVMHRRLSAVANHFDTTFGELAKAGLHLLSYAGRDAVIATVTRSGKIEPTTLYKQFLEAAGDIKPKMMGIASSANVYAGSEVDRSQVQQFISLLTRLAMVSNGTCHLISHPSLTGINTDTGLSGNTQWHNAVRARCYLKSAKPEAGEQPDNDLRELVFKKNNYGPVSETIVLRYQNGLFLPLPGIGSLDKIAQEAKADDIFLDLLGRFSRENRSVSYKPGTTYAPAIFAREDEAKKANMSSKALEAAMRRLFQTGKIHNEQHGRPSRPHYRLAIKS